MRGKLGEIGFWAVVGVLVSGGLAMAFAKPPLQIVGAVIFIGTLPASAAVAALALLGLDKVLLRAARWLQRVRQGR